MIKQVFRWLDPLLLLGLFISVAIAAAMVFSGNDTIFGLLVGLLSVIITLLVDVIYRIQRVESSFLEAASLSRLLADKELGGHLRAIAVYYDSIRQYDFAHFRKLADLSLESCTLRLQEIASGSAWAEVKTLEEYGVIGVDEAKQSIKAVHIGSPTFFIETEFGREYLRRNCEAAKRGVKITRVFALTANEAKNFGKLLEEHENCGINVLVVRPDRLSGKEYMIFDDRILLNFEVDQAANYTREEVVLEPIKVQRAVEQFDRISMHAKSLQVVADLFR